MSSASYPSPGRKTPLVRAALWLLVFVLAQFSLNWGASGTVGLATTGLDLPRHELSQDRVSGISEGLRLKSEGRGGGDPVPTVLASHLAPRVPAGNPNLVPSCVPAPATTPAHRYEACGPPRRR